MIAPAKNLQAPTILLTPRDAACALAISERTLARLARRGDVHPIRLGGGRLVRYSLAELEKLAARVTTPPD